MVRYALESYELYKLSEISEVKQLLISKGFTFNSSTSLNLDMTAPCGYKYNAETMAHEFTQYPSSSELIGSHPDVLILDDLII